MTFPYIENRLDMVAHKQNDFLSNELNKSQFISIFGIFINSLDERLYCSSKLYRCRYINSQMRYWTCSCWKCLYNYWRWYWHSSSANVLFSNSYGRYLFALCLHQNAANQVRRLSVWKTQLMSRMLTSKRILFLHIHGVVAIPHRLRMDMENLQF